MPRIRTLIVDDEPLARERIRQMLKGHSDIEIVGECGNAAEALAAIRKIRPDLVFLDVQMPQMDGFGILEQLETARMPGVIFVTAYDKYAVKAFDVHAIDYLLKPFKRKRFDEAVNRFKQQTENQTGALAAKALALLEDLRRPFVSRLLIPKEKGQIFIKIEDIDWFEADDNYVRVHIGQTVHLLRESLKRLEDQLDPEKFLRIHRSVIVNLDRIRELQPWFHHTWRVVLHNGTVVPMSRRFKQRLSAMLDKGSLVKKRS